MSNTWGSLTWSAGNYGAQNDFTQLVSGVSVTSSLGNQSIELNTFEPATGSTATLSVGDTSIDLLNMDGVLTLGDLVNGAKLETLSLDQLSVQVLET